VSDLWRKEGCLVPEEGKLSMHMKEDGTESQVHTIHFFKKGKHTHKGKGQLQRRKELNTNNKLEEEFNMNCLLAYAIKKGFLKTHTKKD
jgi:translation elongation factor P/translation initiation factor 5A